jgi:hypothetical protein
MHRKQNLNIRNKNIKPRTINDIILTFNTVSKVSLRGSSLLAAGFSVSLDMVDFPSDDDVIGTDIDFSVLGVADFRSDDDVIETETDFLVVRITVGARVVLQSTSVRTSQCLFSYSEGPLQVKFGNVETLLEMMSNKSFISQSQFHGLLSAFNFSIDDGTSVVKHDSDLSLGR